MKRLVFTLVVALLSALAARGQQSPARGQQNPPLVVDVDLVNLIFNVVDDDRMITGLTRDDFEVYEDGVRQEIRDFEGETGLPLTVAVAIDSSGSVREEVLFEQEAAVDFFYSTMQAGRDRGMLVAFDSGVDILHEFTDRPEELAESVRVRAGGGTALYDAMTVAIRDGIAQQPEGRRVLIVITDGDDNASRVSLTETLELAQRNGVAIYAISTDPRGEERGERTLKRFARDTGGRAFFPFREEDLAVNFQDISEELRAQYALSYVPTNPARDGTYREIEIRPLDDDYEVRARPGYFAPQD